jgi:hypothetical protein
VYGGFSETMRDKEDKQKEQVLRPALSIFQLSAERLD